MRNKNKTTVQGDFGALEMFAPIIMAWGIVTFVIYQKHQK